MNLLTWLGIVLGVLVGMASGVLLQRAWARHATERKFRVPSRWLLHARGLVTTEEAEVWKWLRTVFPEHAIMVKVPVMRFTIPSTRDQAGSKDQDWHELLNGVYCSFTVSTLEGKVVGCVDVPGKRGLARAQRDMKEGLLLECGIGYTTVRASSLPSAAAMRTAFLGEAEIVQQEAEETRGGDSSFHAALNEFTSDKVRVAKAAALQELKDKQAAETEPRGKKPTAGFNPDGTGAARTKDKPDRFAVGWEDSFSIQESRPARLS